MSGNADMARHWSGEVGPAWVAERERLDERMVPLTRVLVDELGLEPGERVLDVGCGVGGSSVALARAVGAGGHVLATDISTTMLAAARERAQDPDSDAAPISWLEADAQTHTFELASFNAVASRFGVMFFDDPIAAFGNLRSALRPDGRLVFICWQEPKANPSFFIGLAEIAELVELPDPPAPNTPGPFGLADDRRTYALLNAAGFGEIEIKPVEVEMPFAGTAEDMARHLWTVGPVGTVLRGLEDDPERAAAVRARLTEVVETLERDQGLARPARLWLVRALA